MSTGSQPPTAVRAVQATAVLLAATTAGANAGLSAFAIPRILGGARGSAAAAAQQWAAMFVATSRVFPMPMVFVPALLNTFLAWFFFSSPLSSGSSGGGGGRKGVFLGSIYATVAAATLSIVPYTLAVLGPLNRMLLARDARARQDRLRRRARRVRADADDDAVEMAVAAATLMGHGAPLSDDEEDWDWEVARPAENAAFEAAMADRESTLALVDKWGTRNLYRCGVSFLAAAAGLYAALS